MSDESAPYIVRRDGLRWQVLRIGDDGVERGTGPLRFWRRINALRFASELRVASYAAAYAMQDAYNKAIDFALDHKAIADDAKNTRAFLLAWREGDTFKDWPEFHQ